MDKCFKAIAHSCPLRPHLLEAILLSKLEDWVPYYNFRALLLSDEFVHRDNLLKDLAGKRQYVAGLL